MLVSAEGLKYIVLLMLIVAVSYAIYIMNNIERCRCITIPKVEECEEKEGTLYCMHDEETICMKEINGRFLEANCDQAI